VLQIGSHLRQFSVSFRKKLLFVDVSTDLFLNNRRVINIPIFPQVVSPGSYFSKCPNLRSVQFSFDLFIIEAREII
jgi:hypothetical protein